MITYILCAIIWIFISAIVISKNHEDIDTIAILMFSATAAAIIWPFSLLCLIGYLIGAKLRKSHGTFFQ